MQTKVLLIAMLAAAIPTIAQGLGADHPTDQPVNSNHWPNGLEALVNIPQRVHGYFVNEQDIFFFAGATDVLNAFLKDYSQLPDTRLHVVLHPGQPEVKSPWDKQPRSLSADWKLYSSAARGEVQNGQIVGPYDTKLDIWTGGQVDLTKLDVPPKVAVEAGDDAKGDEAIERFALDHQKPMEDAKAAKEVEETSPPSGIYRLNYQGPGTKVERNDGIGHVFLGDRVSAGLGQATMYSLENDNSRFRVELKGAGPVPGGSNVGPLAVVVAGECLPVGGHTERAEDGTIDMGVTVTGEVAARCVAEELGVDPRLRRHPGHQLLVRFSPEKKSYAAGESVTLVVTIKNVGDETIAFQDGGMQRGARNNQFGFMAFHEKAIPDTGDPANFGGISTSVQLEPGEIFTKQVDLADWFKFEKPGGYSIIGMFRLLLHDPQNRSARDTLWEDFAVAECVVRIQDEMNDASDQADASPAAQKLPKGLEFLRDVPELHALRLEMTEDQFKDILAKQKLTVQVNRKDNRTTYFVTTDRGRGAIVMFTNGVCSGIQGMRDGRAG